MSNNQEDDYDYSRHRTTLDFNEHRQGNIPENHRYSVKQVNEGIQSIDPIDWSNKMTLPKNDFFSYPADLELAELHRQCQYKHPDQEYLKSQEALKCLCCNQKLQRGDLNVWTYDVYTTFVKEHGITLPLYFTFLKLHLIIMTFQFITYGLFVVINSKMICNAYPDLKLGDPGDEGNSACEFVGTYGFIDLTNFRDKIHDNYSYNIIYQALAFTVFIINICVPLIHEVIISYTKIKYFDMEITNHVKDYKYSVYVKHLPHKMTLEEIQETIQKALHDSVKKPDTSQLFEQDSENIKELVYIYDIHEIKELNDQRVSLFSNILLIVQQLKELQEDGVVTSLTIEQKSNKKLKLNEVGLKGEFKSKIQELMLQTTRIKQYLKEGLPFTNKVIIKFKSRELRDLVYLHYKKSFWEQFKIRVRVLKRSMLEVDSRKKVSDYDVDSDESSRTGSSLQECFLKDEETLDSGTKLLPPNTLLMMQNNYDNDKHDHKELRIYRGFKAQEINWENIGMNTLTRFLLRIKTLGITIVTCSIMMILFELMYLYPHTSTYKLDKKANQLDFFQTFSADLFSIMVTVVSSISTIVLLGQTVKSRRSTYTQEEKNIVSFQLFIQLILITSFPYLMSFQYWDGQSSLVPIYDLVSLAKNRIIFKCIFHTFHLRNVTFWCRKRKIVKNFNPNLYFQGQLNLLFTPPYFPQRGRLLAMFFIYTTGVSMLYICPMIVPLCLVSDIFLYFYDKRKVVETFRIDPKFSITHMQYLITVYLLIMSPLNIYLYLRLFWWSKICVYVGTSLSVSVIFIYIFFRTSIIKFIVKKVLRPERVRFLTKFKAKTYLQSYNDYFQELRIENLTTLLSSLFKQITTQRDSVKLEQSI